MKTDKVKYFLMFAGYPRSGHTLVASILNAHPNVICSNQQFILPKMNFNRIISSIQVGLHRSQWNPNAYIEPLPKQDMTVIGDKTGHRTIEHLISIPEDLEKFKSIIPWPIKWIHVVRNPYDCLATWTQKNHNNRPVKKSIQYEFNMALQKFRELNNKITELKKTEDILTIVHERVVRNIDMTLDSICSHLEIEKTVEWRRKVIDSIWKEPRITRKKISWNPQMLSKVVKTINSYPWLQGYEFGG